VYVTYDYQLDPLLLDAFNTGRHSLNSDNNLRRSVLIGKKASFSFATAKVYPETSILILQPVFLKQLGQDSLQLAKVKRQRDSQKIGRLLQPQKVILQCEQTPPVAAYSLEKAVAI
jgi:hypothetical protein